MDSIYTFSDLENIHSFMISLKRKANRLGIKLEITNNDSVDATDTIQCSGYFQETFRRKQGILTVATGLPIKRWLAILVHESCHMDQWEEKINLWKLCDKLNPNVIDEWLEGKNFSNKKIDDAINSTRDLELDCEKRAVDKIKKFNLPLNINEYIQKANCYIFYHNYVRLTRTWYKIDNIPTINPNIYKLCDKKWYDSYETIPNNLLSAFKKYKI